MSKEKVMEELPVLTDKPDTIKRYLSALEQANLINRKVIGNRIFISITAKGKLWNRKKLSESGREKNPPLSDQVGKKIPPKQGKKSPLSREKNPPYHNTNDQPTNDQNKESKPKKTAKPSLHSRMIERYSNSIPESSIDDALEHRKAKGAANTERSHTMFFDEVLQCSQELQITPSAVIDIVIQRDWKGINTEWVRNHLRQARPAAPVVQNQPMIAPPNSRQAVSDSITNIHDTDW
ncbi:hypothetical protein [Marinomonas piezotolerans]|nr:hypothetical protein [Marinomonas piezotolerans]